MDLMYWARLRLVLPVQITGKTPGLWNYSLFDPIQLAQNQRHFSRALQLNALIFFGSLQLLESRKLSGNVVKRDTLWTSTATHVVEFKWYH